MVTSDLCITFHGAARTVTGSMHHIRFRNRHYLLDCGLYQGRRSEARERNTTFPFRPKDVDVVILSHAHIDHCGNLPNLVKQGFAGPIYCTPATRDLIAVMLADSAKIQEEDAAFLNRKKPKDQAIQPLYNAIDVRNTLRRCQAIPYHQTFHPEHDLEVRFTDAGHILGSAITHLRFTANGTHHTVTFTGDLGRPGTPILRDPEPLPEADWVITESTYGGRLHEPPENSIDALGVAVKRILSRGGKVLIPAFSLGRTQSLLYDLQGLIRQGAVPATSIFVDSPLALASTNVYAMHSDCFDDETMDLLEADADLISGNNVYYLQRAIDSMTLNERLDPCIIIAASGMCEAGRILHHLKHHVGDPKNGVLIVSYQAEHTLGWKLVKRWPVVRILDREIEPKAEVVPLPGLSSHADHQDLLNALLPIAGRAKGLFLVHGELRSAEALAEALKEQSIPHVHIPEPGFKIEV